MAASWSSLPSPTLTNPDMILPDEYAHPGRKSPSLDSLEFMPSLSTSWLDNMRSTNEEELYNLDGSGDFHDMIGNKITAALELKRIRDNDMGDTGSESNRAKDLSESEDVESMREKWWEHNKNRVSVLGATGGSHSRSGSAATAIASDSRIETINEEDDGEDSSNETSDDIPSNMLSKEAERILENAKRRLTTMEGNLTRARSTSSRMSTSLFGLGSRVRPERRAQTSLAGALMRQRAHDVSAAASAPSHSRQNTNDTDSPPQPLFRSRSALGSTSVARYDLHPDLRSQEDSSDGSGSADGVQKGKPRVSSLDDCNSLYPSTSTTGGNQIQGLQDQVTDLKLKISTLKVKAQADNLRRRSMQSLRTPSPLTQTKQWYAIPGYRPPAIQTASKVESFERKMPSLAEEREKPAKPVAVEPGPAVQEASGNEEPGEIIPSPVVESPAPRLSTLITHYDSGKAEGRNSMSLLHSEPPNAVESMLPPVDELLASFPATPSSESSLVEPEFVEKGIREEDTGEHGSDLADEENGVPDTTPHEEREDAFDYEHFILHSALGNYSHGVPEEGSSDSSSTSEGSVETAREGQRDVPTRQSRRRRNSVDSVSTEVTFATATEGLSDGSSSVDGDDGIPEIDRELYGARTSRPGSRTPTPRSNSRAHAKREPDAVPSATSTPRASVTSGLPSVKSTATTTVTTPTSDVAVQTSPDKMLDVPSIIASLSSTIATRYAPESVHLLTGVPNTDSSSATAQSVSCPEDQVGSCRLPASDVQHIEALFQSLGQLAFRLGLLLTEPEPGLSMQRSIQLLRDRIDGAKRVLDGRVQVPEPIISSTSGYERANPPSSWWKET